MELRRGKAGASACPAAGRGGAVARRAGRRCAGKSLAVREELQCNGCGWIRTGAIEPHVENVGAIEEKAADEIRWHCELLVEDLKVARCEQTMTLAEAEGASVAQQSEGRGPS
jgi:hypothetical protein